LIIAAVEITSRWCRSYEPVLQWIVRHETAVMNVGLYAVLHWNAV